MRNLFRIKNKRKRKVRTDKKREVRPTISIKLKEQIERLGFILDMPIKDLGVTLFDEGIRNKDVIELLSVYLTEEACLEVDGTLYYGHTEYEIPTHFEGESTDRISLRFPQRNYSDVQLLSRLMDVTPSRAVAVMIDSAIRHIDIIELLLQNHNKRMSLGEEVEKELKNLVRYINRDNPYRRSWNKLLLDFMTVDVPKKISNRRQSRNLIDAEDYDRIAIGRETYKWNLEDDPIPARVPFQAGQGWSVPVGVADRNNVFRYHDFEKIPHMVLGGATRYGKSNFINSMITSLLQSQPDHVRLFLIDLKGGVELCDYEHVKQTESIAYEPDEALRTLQKAYDKMRDIQVRIRKLGMKNVQEARIKERYFIIIDEVGELNPTEAIGKEEKTIKQECQTLMSQIARLGAGLGFRQILATQYPTGDIIPRQCKQNSDAKIAFRVQSATASRVVLDGTGAENLPEIVGRAIYQTADKREILQTPLITAEITRKVIARYGR